LNSFNFTLPHAPNVKASVHFRSGEVPADKDLTGKKVGFVSGWAFSRNCLARQNAWKGNSVPEYTAVMYEDHDDLVNGLLKKEVDAILTTEASDLSKQNIVASDNWFYCATAGPSVMVQYGADVTDWWNHALERLISNGSYRRLCQKAKDTHGSHGNIQCLEQ
jgi:ABC-type amino acid transport substrate-binding protein